MHIACLDGTPMLTNVKESLTLVSVVDRILDYRSSYGESVATTPVVQAQNSLHVPKLQFQGDESQ